MKKILFVCVENSCRSQIAEAFAKMHGKGILEAYSSGSRPSGIVNPKAITSMKEIGYDLSNHNSIGLDKIPQVQYDYAITMGCGDECPMINAINREDWGLPDPKNMEPQEFNRVRDIIEEEVKDLISKIAQEKD
jgi:arsenate reductase (thioredoxin)